MIGIYEGGSVYDSHGFPEKDLSEYKELKSIGCIGVDTHCPYCGESVEYVTEPDEYEIDGETYPQYYNEDILCCADGGWHDWDELHKCKKCGKLFVLRNGCL